MNTATIIVDIFITCINTCKDKWSYKRCLYREPQKINNSTLPGNASDKNYDKNSLHVPCFCSDVDEWDAFGKWLMSSGTNAAGSRVTVRFQFIRAVLHTFVAE